MDRCATLDDTLGRLARLYPQVKFLRARAGALGFATNKSTVNSSSTLRPPFQLHRTPSRKILVPGRFPTDSDSDSDDDDSEEEKSDDGWGDDAVDTDVLPTLLVYRAGDLVHSWIRVDWEAKMGVEELLRRCVLIPYALPEFTMNMRDSHHILVEGGSNSNCGLPSDDDDEDLIFTGSDGEF